MATVDVDIKALLAAGAHFGHKTSRWHPKMGQYIHSKRGGSHIIDLTKTVTEMEIALDFIANSVANGKQVLFVGTKRQAQDIMKKAAIEAKQPYVTERWLGGMLTNWNTVSVQIKRLKDLETRMENGQLAAKYNKLEVQRFQEEIDDKELMYGGIKDMPGKPGAVFITDTTHDVNAVREARKLGVPIVALADTNSDPTLADYPIPCNDDAIKTLELVADYLKQAVAAGQAKATKNVDKTDKAE